MKRTPLKRSPLKRFSAMERKPINRTPMKRRPRRNDDPALRAEWASQQPQRCAVCWAPSLFSIELHRHHILGGARRIDDPRNLLLLCMQWGDLACRCHDLFHGERIPRGHGTYWPNLSLGMLVGVKRDSDQANYDPEWLQSTLGRRRLPEIEPLPQEFITERQRWQPTSKTA